MSEDHNPSDILGKKIFFLYPSATIQNQVIAELVQQEFEVYAVRDHLKLQKALKNYPGSVVFVNLNDQLPEPQCGAWIRDVKADPATAQVEFGVITTAEDKSIQQKYSKVLGVNCGCVVLKTSLVNQAVKQILDTLKTIDAKGRRKYIRAASDDDPTATINLPQNNGFVQGNAYSF